MRSLFLVLILVAISEARNCDSETSCGDDETCCKLGDDKWGCCPLENAVCCDDHTHCCPAGTKCDPEGARCILSTGSFYPMRKKKPARPVITRNEFNEVVCPDKSSKCPEGSTCCMLEQGDYGCCPVPKAVCCPDMLHCCPNGFTCHGQFCSQKYANIPHLRKFKSTPIHRKPAIEFLDEENQESDESDESDSLERQPDFLKPIMCGVGKTCPAKSTCCARENENGSVQNMCCPLSNAVCCRDTCCPSGYHCVEGGKCEKHARIGGDFIF